MTQRAILDNKNEINTALSSILQTITDSFTLCEENEYFVRLVYRELLLNALNYSKNDKIVLMFNIKNGTLRSCIYDRGVGFDPEKHIMNCPDIASEKGRGIFLANQLCRSLRYNKKGDCVYFEIDLVNNL